MDNLVIKAYRLLQKDFPLEPVEILLHKSIPAGSGLGGGSSDAAFMLKLLNDSQKLGLTATQLEQYAAILGADCAFFVQNRALLAYDKGDRFQAVDLSLKGFFLILLIPKNIQVSTREAYAGNKKPAIPQFAISDCICLPPEKLERLPG
jgi:4-diphosphocytidyl-2-C-methyl-D-erythritol kinase